MQLLRQLELSPQPFTTGEEDAGLQCQCTPDAVMLRMLSLPPTLQHIPALQTVGQSAKIRASCTRQHAPVSPVFALTIRL